MSIRWPLTIGALSSVWVPAGSWSRAAMMSLVLCPNSEVAAAPTRATPAIKRPYLTRPYPSCHEADGVAA